MLDYYPAWPSGLYINIFSVLKLVFSLFIKILSLLKKEGTMRIMRINNNKRSLTNPAYSPLRNMLDELLSMQSWFDDVFNRSLMPSFNYNMAMADVWEEDENYFIKMALPGVDKDNVDVQVEGNVVRIKGGKKEEEKSEEGKQYYLNRLETYFEQTFTLPGDVDVEKIEAKMKNGVLELKLPKVAQNKPKQITIKSE